MIRAARNQLFALKSFFSFSNVTSGYLSKKFALHTWFKLTFLSDRRCVDDRATRRGSGVPSIRVQESSYSSSSTVIEQTSSSYKVSQTKLKYIVESLETVNEEGSCLIVDFSNCLTSKQRFSFLYFLKISSSIMILV